ncbi:hypothetical protein [Xanthomonas theicola]|uniref:Uncharacterized protein n=1 Tax=Xanthomonas theicola TaxID=56464 RepID=A0A2S6ZDA1_9XANT|nr:hypothetical protein [Xanthomonas theicola]PPT90231.1 hypothetical protein XthCFBP4691_13425 [Xanthomonas theicola]QNH25346.1 hypothetical protein G4Q83_12170 [Xanthomonas theicola]
MAYFKLAEQTQLNRYVCDFHSHFTGILPTQRKRPDDARPSLAQLLAQRFYANDAHAQVKGELRLFGYALMLMIERTGNSFARLLHRPDRAEYERAECVAENVYIACQVMAADAGYVRDELALPPQAPTLYELVDHEIIAPALASAQGPADSLRTLVRYFNNKIYGASKYTPFDDAYKLRGHFVKQLCQGDPAKYDSWSESQKADYRMWVRATFDFLREDGVLLIQAAAAEDEIPQLAQLAQGYNEDYGTDYRLLVHSPHHYMRDGALSAHLTEKVAPLLTGQGNGHATIVGLDLLGAENKVGNYAELFAWLQANAGALGGNFGAGAGAGAGKRALRAIVHIHCGEGSGFGTENRSVVGYYMHQVGDPDRRFYAALSAYVLDAWSAAQARRRDSRRGSRGTAVPQGLFEELFANTAFSHGGHVLRRFDVNAPLSRELAGYHAKRNVMALSQTLDQPSATPGTDCYHALVHGNALFAFRLGHDYYYRSYMAARYPWLAFDTNLGSNVITGASGVFDSVQGYRLNRGYRQLDGYIDTDVLEAVGNAVLSMESQGLDRAQIARFLALGQAQGDLATTLQQNRQWLQEQLRAALGPIYEPAQGDFLFDTYCKLALYCAGDAPAAALRYQAMVRVLLVFQNWRSYLLGADGQGVEHTGIQHEYLRMLVLLVYKLLPNNQNELQVDLLQTLSALLRRLALGYWRVTIGQPATLESKGGPLGLESLDGFKGPASVVVVRRAPPAKP